MNKPPQQGLSSGLKTMLIVLGLILAIIIFLIWSAIIRSGSELTSGNMGTAPEQTTQAPVDEATPEEPDQVAQARNVVIDMVNAPACENAQNDANALSELVQRSQQSAEGLIDDDRQLIVDTLKKIDADCPKPFTLDLANALSGSGVNLDLAQIAEEANWVSKERPAPEGAQALTDFTTDSKNIHCTIESSRVACSIYAYSYPSEPASCETYTQTYVTQSATETDALCSWRLQSTTSRSDGHYANDTFACSVTDGGRNVECWSQLSGHGFEISRDNGRTF